jgi:hypothetical protein
MSFGMGREGAGGQNSLAPSSAIYFRKVDLSKLNIRLAFSFIYEFRSTFVLLTIIAEEFRVGFPFVPASGGRSDSTRSAPGAANGRSHGMEQPAPVCNGK